MPLGTGLGKVKGKVFRIGHLGWFNELMLAGTLCGLPSILLPFVIGVIGVIGNMITGSTTVGVITAASVVAPMLGSLALFPEAAMLAGASGSVIIKYVNSSYFCSVPPSPGFR